MEGGEVEDESVEVEDESGEGGEWRRRVEGESGGGEW